MTLEEIEFLFSNAPRVFPDPFASEKRLRAIGCNAAGRYLYVVFKGDHLVKPSFQRCYASIRWQLCPGPGGSFRWYTQHVSRIITRLERKLGARLIERSTRRLNVTEVGREVTERATGILLALEETENSVAQSQGTPTGTLRLTAGPEFGIQVVNPWIATYLRTYPENLQDAH